MLAGACCLDRSVEGQNIGLKSDAVDHTDDIGHLVRALADLVHGRHHTTDHRAALRSSLRRLGSQLTRLACIVGVLLYRGGQLLHTRRGFRQRSGLLLGTGGKLAIASGDILGTNVDALTATAYRADSIR